MKSSFVVPGALLILLGLLTPSRVLIEALRPFPADAVLAQKLLLGAALFRLGLFIHGLILLAFSSGGIRNRIGWTNVDGNAELAQQPRDRYTVLLLLLLIVSAAVRFYKLGEGLWLDEILMYVRYVKLPFGQLITTYDSENQHFLYTILARISSLTFTESGWAMRFPALLFGIASIWALFLLGTVLASPREGLLAASLLSLSYYHVWFSQNARGYSGLLFWAIFSSWLFVRALSTRAPFLWIGYAIAIALGMFTQFIMIFVVAGQFLIYLYALLRSSKQTERWNGFLLGFVLGGMLTFQLYALVLPQFFDRIGMHGTVARWTNPLWTLSELMRGLQVNFAGGFAALAALIVFATGFWNYSRTRPILIWLLIIPPVLGSIVVISLGHPLWPRFFFFAFGFGALIVIRGGLIVGGWIAKSLQRILRHSHKLEAESIGLVLCCIFILISAAAIPLAYAPKQDFLGAQRFVEQSKSPGDAVVTVGRASFPYRHYYNTDFAEVTSLPELNKVRETAQRTWLLYMIPADVQAVYPEIMDVITKDFRLVKEFPSPLADGAIFVCLDETRGRDESRPYKPL